jgi:hypothetical protein
MTMRNGGSIKFLDALAQSDPVDHYVAARNAVGEYVTAIHRANIPAVASCYPRDAELTDFLRKMQKTIGSWVSGAAPLTRELPSQIVEWDPRLQKIIESLKLYAAEAGTSDVTQLIVATAGAAVDLISPACNAISSLAQQLSPLSADLASDAERLDQHASQARQDVRNWGRELGSKKAECQSEASKICPNNARLEELGRELERLTPHWQGAQAWSDVLACIADKATPAAPSVQYLESSWRTFGDEVKHVLAMARLIRSDPSHLATVQLKDLGNSWATVKTNMSEIARGSDPSSRAGSSPAS